MADGVKEIRFWHGWPEAPGGGSVYDDCDTNPDQKILFKGQQIAFSDDSAVDPDASPPVQEDCCCCAECEYCTNTKKPSMVTVTFSGVAAGDDCDTAACATAFNGTVFELKCSRSGDGVTGGGTCCYEVDIDTQCYNELLYCIHSNYDPGGGSIETPFVQVGWDSGYYVTFRKSAGMAYDIDCTGTRSDLTDVHDEYGNYNVGGDLIGGEYCDWSGASVTVDPFDCGD